MVRELPWLFGRGIACFCAAVGSLLAEEVDILGFPAEKEFGAINDATPGVTFEGPAVDLFGGGVRDRFPDLCKESCGVERVFDSDPSNDFERLRAVLEGLGAWVRCGGGQEQFSLLEFAGIEQVKGLLDNRIG